MRKWELEDRIAELETATAALLTERDSLLEQRNETGHHLADAHLRLAQTEKRAAAAQTALAVLRRELRELREQPDPIRDELLRHRIIVNLVDGGSLRGVCLALTPEYVHVDRPEWIPEGKENAEARHDYPAFVERAKVRFILLDK